MKQITQAVLLVALIFSQFACSSTGSIYLDEGYQKNSLNNSFVVVPLKKDWVADAVVSPLSGTAKDYLYIALESSFKSSTANSVEIIDRDLEFPNGSFERKKLESGKMVLDVNLPPDSLLNSFPERYAYFFEGYGFRIMENNTTGSSYAGNESTIDRVLVFKTEFYLLDKTTNEIISWGVVADQAQIVDKPEFNHYLEVITKVSKKIVSKGPFQTRP